MEQTGPRKPTSGTRSSLPSNPALRPGSLHLMATSFLPEPHLGQAVVCPLLLQSTLLSFLFSIFHSTGTSTDTSKAHCVILATVQASRNLRSQPLCQLQRTLGSWNSFSNALEDSHLPLNGSKILFYEYTGSHNK